jgi:hypothetical protein
MNPTPHFYIGLVLFSEFVSSLKGIVEMMTSVRFGGIYNLGRFDLKNHLETKGQAQANVRIVDAQGQPLNRQVSQFAAYEKSLKTQDSSAPKAMRIFGEQGQWGILADDERGNHKTQFAERFKAIRNLWPDVKTLEAMPEPELEALKLTSAQQYLDLTRELFAHPDAVDAKLVVKDPNLKENARFEIVV